MASSPVVAQTQSAALPPAPTPQPSVPAPAAPPMPPPPQTPGKAWVLMDFQSGQVLAGHNEHEPLDPASLTKVMTSYVVAAEMAHGKIKPTDEVLISENAWRQGGAGTEGSFSALPVNGRVKIDDVIHGLVIQSGNDAAIALAEHVAGTEQAFAALMNSYAQQIGMRDSHFLNSHGLTVEGHRVSAYDMALLSRALVRDFPEHYAIYAIKDYTYNGIKQYNRNGLLWKDPSVDGVKTGHTEAAGYCLAASAKRGDQRLISVVMGIEGSRKEGFRQREDANLALLNWGFRFFETHTVYTTDATVAEPKLWKGEQDTVALGVAQPLLVTLPRGRYAEVQASMELPQQITAPLAKGQEIGRVKLMLDGKPLADQALVVKADMAEGGFFKRSMDGFWIWWESE